MRRPALEKQGRSLDTTSVISCATFASVGEGEPWKTPGNEETAGTTGSLWLDNNLAGCPIASVNAGPALLDAMQSDFF